MKKILAGFCALFLLLGFTEPVFAVVDPLAVPNNKVGIHILKEEDINDAANLVNTNGDWGYVTLVIQDTDRDHDKWQKIFDTLREKHLIPIVRIATHGEGETWVKPAVGEAPAWASFLNSLNWVVKNRYVVVFNEPNHASEWSGNITPSEYADVLSSYSQELKKENSDFYILNAGFDSSAPNGRETEDEQTYIAQMLAHNAQVFDNIDGWDSHSYPNPGFSAKPDQPGRHGIKGYEWELATLKSLGVEKTLPVFLTETGWSRTNLSEDTIGKYYQDAYENYWNDPKVAAVTPFVFDYQAAPFANFSWKKPDGFTAQYDITKSLNKTKGKPQQEEKLELKNDLPQTLITNSTYLLPIELQNTGQTIWDEKDGYYIRSEGKGIQTTIIPSPLNHVTPFADYSSGLSITTPADPGEYIITLSLVKDNQKVGDPIIKKVTVLAPEKN